MSDKIGVVVRTLNEAKHLPKLAFGLAQQSKRISDMVLVDSGSEDGTPEIGERLGVFPMAKLSAPRAIRLCSTHLVLDDRAAAKDREVFLLTPDILGFRIGQFYGAWRGGREASSATRGLLREIYYPRRKNQPEPSASSQASRIDYEKWNTNEGD